MRRKGGAALRSVSMYHRNCGPYLVCDARHVKRECNSTVRAEHAVEQSPERLFMRRQRRQIIVALARLPVVLLVHAVAN